MFPKITPQFFELKKFNEHRQLIEYNSKQIYLGSTNYSLEEIIQYEKTINKKYILGIHDCRHYTNDLTQWCLNYTIPIWDLDSI